MMKTFLFVLVAALVFTGVTLAKMDLTISLGPESYDPMTGPGGGDALLLGTGDYLLLESGDKLLLE